MPGSEDITNNILTDSAFRDRLVRDPEGTLRSHGIEPTPEMVDALKSVDAAGLQKLATAFGTQQAAAA
jgi:hypothetical protein